MPCHVGCVIGPRTTSWLCRQPHSPEAGGAGARAGAQAEAPRLRAPRAGSQSRGGGSCHCREEGARWLHIPREEPASEAPLAAQGPLPPFGTLGLTLGPLPRRPWVCPCLPRLPGLSFFICRTQMSPQDCPEGEPCTGSSVRSALPHQRSRPGQVLLAALEHQGSPRHEAPRPNSVSLLGQAGPLPRPPTSPAEDVGQFLIQVGKVPTQLGKPPNPPSPPYQSPQLSPLPSIRGPPAPLQPACPSVSSGLWALAASSGWPLC